MRTSIFAKLSKDEKDKIRNEIKIMSHPNRSYYAMVVISTVIASYGLLSNSTAIVIGAMLVAPLMGPIFGIAQSLSSGNNKDLKTSVTSEIVGILLSILIAFIIGILPFRTDFGNEIISRTAPTVYDIIVAVAAGIAGSYALINPRIGTALPGVAISTSLVPPLATCGLCLSAGVFDASLGAFVLFLSNFLAIQIASASIFLVFGISNIEVTQNKHIIELIKRFAFSIIMLLIISVFLTNTLYNTISSKNLHNRVRNELTINLRTLLGAQLTDVTISKKKGNVNVTAVVLTPQVIEPELVKLLEKKLQRQTHDNLYLVIRSIISSDADKDGNVYIADSEREKQINVQKQTEILSKSSTLIKSELENVPGAQLVDIQREQNGVDTMIAVVRTPKEIDPTIVKTLEDKLKVISQVNIRLIMRCIIANDISSTGIMYQNEVPEIDQAKLLLDQRLKEAVTNQLRNEEPSCVLEEMSNRLNDGKLYVDVSVFTPRVLTPRSVNRIQSKLQEYVDPAIVLTIKSNLGAKATDNGYSQN